MVRCALAGTRTCLAYSNEYKEPVGLDLIVNLHKEEIVPYPNKPHYNKQNERTLPKSSIRLAAIPSPPSRSLSSLLPIRSSPTEAGDLSLLFFFSLNFYLSRIDEVMAAKAH